MNRKMIVLMGLVFGGSVFCANAEDWPMWRYDAQRSANSPQVLTDNLQLQWELEYPPLEPVWDDPLNQDLMSYDTVYEPVVMGNTLFLGSNACDRLTALDTRSGAEKWSFYADGPVRLPPVAARGKVYFCSDDGCLYCLDAESGRLVWKYRSAARERLILGNERLISTWCARGGPVIQDGVVYYAAGIWPFMGVFIFALDAETGREIWVNDNSGAIYIKQPHNSPSFAGIAPQGSLVISGDKLLVPGGRSVPAGFDLKTGEFLYYNLADNNKTGGAFVCASDKYFVNYYRDQVVNLYDLQTGERLVERFGKVPVATEGVLYCKGNPVTAMNSGRLTKLQVEETDKDDDTGEIKVKKRTILRMDTLWKCDADADGDLIKAGNRLYAGGKNQVSAIEIPSSTAEAPRVAWRAPINGNAARLIAADDRLFVVTQEGRIYAFGGESRQAQVVDPLVENKPLLESAVNRAKAILRDTGINEGYCLVYEVSDGDFTEALVRNSQLRVIAFARDAQRVDTLRRRYAAAGLYGKRLSVRMGDPLSVQMPPYLASLILFEDAQTAESANGMLLKALFRTLRPYGGMLSVPLNPQEAVSIIRTIRDNNLPNAEVKSTGDSVHLVRAGALPGAADWTHQYGDVAQTVKSDDQLVKLPLGLLWFGGNSNLDVLPRHGHGPPEQVMGGRLFIEGMDSLSARDVYTGAVLWKRVLPELATFGVYYDDTYKETPLSTSTNQVHIPGANARGSNFVVTEDAVYIAMKDHCLVLNPVNGETIKTIGLPKVPGSSGQQEWGYIGVYQNYLIAGSGFVSYMDFVKIDPKASSKNKIFMNFDRTSSKALAVMDRRSGQVLWTFKSELGLWNNAIVAGKGMVFCIDKMPDMAVESLKRRGMKFNGTPRLLAFDLQTGKLRWSKNQDVFGTWLGYSEEHDVLIQTGRYSRDMLQGEPKDKMTAYRGKDGNVLWNNEHTYGGPCIIHGKTIITDPNSYDLVTGARNLRRNPITGEEIPWSFTRQYGCNYAIASEYLMTFRSAAAGFFDLEEDAGTGNFGGFKSGCTSNLIAADGVLNAPDYTRTCSCSYQNQTSLAMIHDPEVEIWTFNSINLGKGPIQRLGVNLGAPGDRRVDQGTLWLEYPIIGGPSPKIPMQVEPAEARWFQHHSSRMQEGESKWIVASGVEGARRIILSLADGTQGALKYTVRLYFAEPEQVQAGERVFNVSLQGKQVMDQFDIIREAGEFRKGIVKQFNDVSVEKDLVIEMQPSKASSTKEPILCGIEVVAASAV